MNTMTIEEVVAQRTNLESQRVRIPHGGLTQTIKAGYPTEIRLQWHSTGSLDLTVATGIREAAVLLSPKLIRELIQQLQVVDAVPVITEGAPNDIPS